MAGKFSAIVFCSIVSIIASAREDIDALLHFQTAVLVVKQVNLGSHVFQVRKDTITSHKVRRA